MSEHPGIIRHQQENPEKTQGFFKPFIGSPMFTQWVHWSLAKLPKVTHMSSAKAREEEARNILARANKNQADDGPSKRKAAIRVYI